MKAAVLYGPGGPDAFSIEQVEVPVCARDEVLIKVEACGVSYRDVVERNGTYRRDVSFPLIIGLEISGIVVSVGENVQDLQSGDHICTKAFSSCGRCRFCRSGRETTCQQRLPVRGGYAEFVSLPQDACVRVPTAIPFEQSCSLGPGAGVALNAVRDVAEVKVGETVLITGAAGGVGYPAVQIARSAGARVLAVTRSAAKEAHLIEAGADAVIVSPSGADFSVEVRERTGGEGVDVVIDTIGSRVFHAAFDSLALHGRYAVVGQLFGEKTEINLARIFFKRAAFLGVGSVSRVQLADAVALLGRGMLTQRVDRILPLDAVAEAHGIVERGEAVGRIVLKP